MLNSELYVANHLPNEMYITLGRIGVQNIRSLNASEQNHSAHKLDVPLLVRFAARHDLERTQTAMGFRICASASNGHTVAGAVVVLASTIPTTVSMQAMQNIHTLPEMPGQSSTTTPCMSCTLLMTFLMIGS